MRSDRELLTLQEAMDLLQISRSTINRWRRNKSLPFLKIGRDVYVDKDKLLAWASRYEHTHNDPDTDKQQRIETVTVGYQSMNAHLWSSLIIKELRLFEEELLELRPRRQIHVQWRDLHGPSQMEELVIGRIQIASIGDYPLVNVFKLNQLFPSFQANLLAFDGKNASSEQVSLVIPHKSDIRTLDQLSGRTVSTFVHSSAWHRLFKALGQDASNRPRIINQNSRQSFHDILNTQVDACTMVEPYLSVVQRYQLGRIIKLEDNGDDYLTGIVADNKWLREHEDIVVAYLKAHLRAHQLLRNSPLRMAKIISEHTDFPLEIVTGILDGIRWDAAIYQRDLQTLVNIGTTHTPAHYERISGGLDTNLLRSQFMNDMYLTRAAQHLRLPQMFQTLFDGAWRPEPIY